MSGFKEGSLQLRKKDVSTAADQNHLKILVDTNNNLYTVDEYGVYRAVAGYDVQVSGTALNLVTSGATKIISLNDTGVVSGSYGGPTIVAAFSVGSDGRILSVSSVPISASGLGTVTSIGLTSNSLSVSSSPITTSGNIIVNLSAIGTSGTFTKFVKDIYGRVTSGGNVTVIDLSDRSTDGTLSANSDNKIPTEKAIKTYVDENVKRLSVGIADSICYDIIDNGDGTATILPQNVYIYDNSDFLGNIKKYSVSGNTFTLTDGIEQHICVKYNSGNPIYYVENDMNAINESDVICVHIVWRVGNTIHSINRDSKGLGLSNKIAKSILKTKPYSISMDGGLILSETSSPTNRTILITSAVVYSGIVPVSVLSFTSVSDKLTLAYHNTGNWSYSSGTTYNNTQYDDGFSLQTISNNKFAVRWFYRSIGDIKETFYVLGNNTYKNIEEAKLEAPRNDLPLVIRRHCVLVGRIIIQYDASSGYVENVTDINFTNTSVPNHNDLNNIQGGGFGEYYHLSASTYSYLSGVTSDVQVQLDSKISSGSFEVLKEPTGFSRIDNTSLLFNNSTRIFTLSALSGNYDVYFRGRKFTKTTETIQIPALSGLHFIYFDSSGTISTSQTPWDILTTIQIAIVYWNGVSAISLGEERHGCVMDCATHAYLHKTQKTQYIDGFDASYTLTNASIVTIGLTEGHIADEDLELYIRHGSINNYLTQPLNTSAHIPVYYRQGTDGNGTWKKDTATVYPFKNNGAGTNVNYNQLSAGNWIQTPVTNNYYVCYFIYATSNIHEPIIAVQGQRQDSDITDAKNNASPLNLLFSDFPVVEGKLLYRLICRVSNAYLQNPHNIRIDDVTDYRTVGITVGGTAGGTGTVTYVGLSANPIMTISGTPITNAGTFTIDYALQTSGTFFAGPTSGNNSTPTFRRIVSADIPNLSNIYYPVSSTGNISGLTSPAQTQLNNLSANYTTRTEVSGISANIRNSLSAYLPLSGGTLTGNLSATQTISITKGLGTTISAATRLELMNNNFTWGAAPWMDSGGNMRIAYLQGDGVWTDRYILNRSGALSAFGNITAPQFNGNLNGYKNVEGGNETTISNGYSYFSGNLYINYRGAVSAISAYHFWNGFAGSGGYSSIVANSFIKNGGTSAQFLKADGSSDSNTYASQSFVNANYLPLSGGNVYGSTTFGNPSNNGYVSIRTNGTSGGIADFNFIGSTSAARRLTFRYNEITDALEFFTSNDNGSARANKMLVYRSSSSATNFYTGLNVATGNLSVQSLSASKLVATDSSKNLISYTLTSADVPNLPQYYPVSSTGNISGLTSPAQIQLNTLSANLLTSSTNLQNQLSAYLPIKNKTTILMSNFFGTSRYLYDQLSGTGLGFTDDRGLNWRGGFVSNNSACGYHQDASSLTSFKSFTISDGGGNVWYVHNPLSAVKHTFYGTTRITGSVSADAGMLVGLNAQEVIRIYRTASATNTTFGQTFEANNNVGQRVIYSRIRSNIDSSVSGLHSGSFIFTNYINGTETTAATLASDQLKVFGTISASGNIIGTRHIIPGGLSTQFLKADGSSDSNTYTTQNFVSLNYLPLTGGTLSGDLNFSIPSTNSWRGVYGNLSGSDWWAIRAKATALNNWRLEISTGDEGNTPIIVTQYGGSTPQSVLTLLDTSGNTIVPNSLYANNVYFSGVLSNNSFSGNKVIISDGSKNIVESNASSTEASYLVGVSANIQTQINQLLQASVSGTGSGTTGYISKFVTGNSVGNSTIYDSGSLVSVYNPLSASGNITAPNFVGILDGSTKIQFGNEVNLVNNFANSNGQVYLNYRGSTSAITDYFLWNGKGSGGSGGTYSNIRANAFVKNGGTNSQYLMADGSVSYSDSLSNLYLPLSGGTLTRNLKISAYSEGWSEGLRVMVPSNNWGGLRLSRNNSTNGTEDNWAIGYANNSTGNLEFDVYTGGSQIKHSIFYKDLGAYFLGGLSASEVRVRNSAILTSGSNNNNIRIKGLTTPTNGFIEFGTGTAYFGYNNTFSEFILKGHLKPDADNTYDLGNNPASWRSVVANSFIKKGGLSSQYLMADGSISYSDSISDKFLPLSGGTLTGNLYINVNGAQSLFFGDDASLGDANIPHSIRIQSQSSIYTGYFVYGNSDATFGLNSNNWFDVNRTIKPVSPDFDLGDNNRYWQNVYSAKFIKPGGTDIQFLMADGSVSYGDHLFSKFLPLSGGTMTGPIYGNGFGPAMLSNNGDANLHRLRMNGLACSEIPTDINMKDDCYIGCQWYESTTSKFANTGKSNSILVSDGVNGGYGGIYFGSRFSNAYIGQRGDTLNLYIKGEETIEFSSNGMSLSASPIKDYMTFNAVYPAGSYLPAGYTYYSIVTNGDFYLPPPIKGKIIYVTLESPYTAYLKPESGATVYYTTYSGTARQLTTSNKILMIRYRTIALMGVSSSEYSLLMPWTDYV